MHPRILNLLKNNNGFYFICILVTFFPLKTFAGWDKSGHHRIRDDTTHIRAKGDVKIERNISKTELYLKEMGVGMASGLTCGLIGGFIGYNLSNDGDEFSGLGMIPGAILGFLGGNSLGLYATAKYYDRNGSYPLILLSETIGLGLSILFFVKCNNYVSTKTSPNDQDYSIQMRRSEAIGFSVCLLIPSTFGLIANDLSCKHKNGKK